MIVHTSRVRRISQTRPWAQADGFRIVAEAGGLKRIERISVDHITSPSFLHSVS